MANTENQIVVGLKVRKVRWGIIMIIRLNTNDYYIIMPTKLFFLLLVKQKQANTIDKAIRNK